VEAVSVQLRGGENKSSTFSVNLKDEFNLEIFVDPQGEKVTGVSIYLSFDDEFLELIDGNFGLSGLQPVARGPATPDGWNIFENDTHGDPGNRFLKFQIDFSQGLIRGDEPALREPGVVGIIHLRAIRTAVSTLITFDNIKAVSRVTEVKVGLLPPKPFTSTMGANISVVGGPVIFDSFPKLITIPLGTVNNSLDLDGAVEDSNNTPEQLNWETDGNTHIIVDIDPASHIVSFSAPEGWVGEETIVFTVSDPSGNTSTATVRVQVVSGPVIKFDGPFRARTNQPSRFDLNQFVTDADDPTLSGIRWDVTRGTDLASIALEGSDLFISGEKAVRTSIELTATDADGNSDSAEVAIEIAPAIAGPIVDFSHLVNFSVIPGVIATSDGSLMHPPNFDLDDFVFDFDFPPEELKWTAKGNANIQVDIDPSTRRVRFHSDGWLGKEPVTFTATNPNNLQGRDTVPVMLIDPSAPPVIAEIPPIVLEFKKKETRDLKQYVIDLDSSPEQIEWVFNGYQQIQITTDGNRIATFFAEAIVSETVTFTAIDPQSNQTRRDVFISVRKPSGPQIRNLPPEIKVRFGEVTEGFDLDDFVTDATTADPDIQWTVSGFNEGRLEVTIEPDHRTLFNPKLAWLSGTEEATFTATNEAGVSASATTVVIPIFNPVIFLDGVITLREGEQNETLDLDAHVQDNDHLDEELTWEIGAVTGIEATIHEETHVVTITAPEGAVGAYEIVFTATDPDGNSDDGKLIVNVIRGGKPTKSAPVVSPFPEARFVQGESDSSIRLDDYVADADTPKTQIRWTFEGNVNIQAAIDPQTLTVTFTAVPDFIGAEEITFTATDPDNLSDSETIRVTVVERSKENQPPVVGGMPDVTFVQGGDASIVLDNYVTDETPDERIQWTFAGNIRVQATIDVFRRATFTAPSGLWEGTETITFVATDEGGLTGSQTIRVTVLARPTENQPPVVAGIPDVTFVQGQSDSSILLDDYVADETPDNQIRWTFAGNTSVQVTIDPATRRVTLTAPSDFAGTENITFTATDSGGLSGSQSIRAAATAKPTSGEPPVISSLPTLVITSGVPNREIDLDEFVTDADTPVEQLTWATGAPKNLTIEIDPATHIVKIVPKPGFVGNETIRLTATDPQGNSGEGALIVEVRATPAPTKHPMISFERVEMEADAMLEIELDDFVFDADTPDAEITWRVDKSERIAVVIDPQTHIAQLQLRPEAKDFLGSELITLSATDPQGNSDAGSLEVLVKKPKDRTPPTFRIAVFPNPIQPDFLTLAVTASETLREKPTLLVSQKPVQVKEIYVNTWTGVHVLPKPIPASVVIIARGSDLEGNSGQSTKTLRFHQFLAAPAAPLSYLRVNTYPNPTFSHEVTIECQLNSPATLTVEIYDVAGRLVQVLNDDRFRPVPNRLARSCRWELTDDLDRPLASGVYFCCAIAESGGVRKTHFWKMVVRR
jgi:hypothetical protein